MDSQIQTWFCNTKAGITAVFSLLQTMLYNLMSDWFKVISLQLTMLVSCFENVKLLLGLIYIPYSERAARDQGSGRRGGNVAITCFYSVIYWPCSLSLIPCRTFHSSKPWDPSGELTNRWNMLGTVLLSLGASKHSSASKCGPAKVLR